MDNTFFGTSTSFSPCFRNAVVEGSLIGFDAEDHRDDASSSGPASDQRTPSYKVTPAEDRLSSADRDRTMSPSSQGRLDSPSDLSTELESRRRMLSALNLFSAHPMKDSPGIHRVSGSVGDNLCPSPLGPFDTVQTQAYAFLTDEPDTTATGSDIEVLSRCTSTNDESGQMIGLGSTSFERTGEFQKPLDASGLMSTPHGTSTLSRLSDIHFSMECLSRPREEDLSYAFQRLIKKYADKKALLQIREAKILQLSRENCGLREVNATLGELAFYPLSIDLVGRP
ncbi:unnamed protein product [Echinostoma caproni]|uniref:Uncharacterized protein n=1 Tax=Echinostoma caproni TaxID=27848 RepID=A0A3P8L5H0_9TREM|nr:unnamed protein product [Echinostoma caproni]